MVCTHWWVVLFYVHIILWNIEKQIVRWGHLISVQINVYMRAFLSLADEDYPMYRLLQGMDCFNSDFMNVLRNKMVTLWLEEKLDDNNLDGFVIKFFHSDYSNHSCMLVCIFIYFLSTETYKIYRSVCFLKIVICHNQFSLRFQIC